MAPKEASTSTKRKRADDEALYEAANAKRRSANSEFSETVEVIVGADLGAPQSFVVHKDLLCENSDFFTAALSNDRWTESNGVIRMPSHYPEEFKTYTSWLYSGAELEEIAADDAAPFMRDRMFERSEMATSYLLAKCWVFGQYLQDTRFQNAVMVALLRHGSDWLADCCMTQADTVSDLVGGISTDSKLLDLLVNTVASELNDEKVEIATQWPPQFMVAVFKKILRDRF